MSPEESFVVMVARLRARDKDAAERVWTQFVCRLIALARENLDTRVRGKIDPEDVVQSVFHSFFHRHAEGQYELTSWNGLWGLLAQITVRKCVRQERRFHGPVHDVGKEIANASSGDGS